MQNNDMRLEIVRAIEEILQKESDSLDLNKAFSDVDMDSILFIELIIKCEIDYKMKFEDDMILMSAYSDIETFVNYVQSRCEIV